MLERRQVLPLSVAAAWVFFSTPANLARITPPEMGLTIRTKELPSSIHSGQRITYTVRPLFALPLRWVTLITVVEPPYRFIDTQERGPYALWEHEHRFEPHPAGTLMHDRVVYRLPLDVAGMLHRSFVRPKLERIFAHRRAVLERLFPFPGTA